MTKQHELDNLPQKQINVNSKTWERENVDSNHY